MKRILIALAASSALIGAAQAGDLNHRGSLKDPVERQGRLPEPEVQQERAISWTGFYIGGRIGYGNANHDLSLHEYFKDYCTAADTTADAYDGFADPFRPLTVDNINKAFLTTFKSCSEIDKDAGKVGIQPFDTSEGASRKVLGVDGVNSSGIVGGGQLGYDQQVGRFVVGVFGSYDLASMDTEVSAVGTNITAIEKGDEWSLGVRGGILLGQRTFAYVLAAYTETEYTFAGIGKAGSDKDVNFSGITVGAGLEHALTQNVFLGIEGTHTFYDSESLVDAYDSPSNPGVRRQDEIGETKVMGTLKIKLNNDIGKVFD